MSQLDNGTYISILKLIDYHDKTVRELNRNVARMDIEFNALLRKHECLEAFVNQKKSVSSKAPPSHSRSTILKAIKENLSTFTTVMVAVIGATGTILFEVGKYLRNLPVN